jgi:hypothetical protein
MMLATRVRLTRSVATAAIVAVGLFAWREARSVDVHAAQVHEPVRAERHRDRCGAVEAPRSDDTLVVYLHEPAEWTGVEVESDWAKTFRMVWDGPIRSWTTMRLVRVPSLDHRMIESIAPWSIGHGNEVLRLRVKVRVVVPGDLDAALEWARVNPAVASAEVSIAE